MPPTTITGNFSATYTLTSAQNPAVLDPGFVVSIPTGVSNSYTPGVLAPAGTVWTVTNQGSVTAQYGFELDGTGVLTNAASGRLTGRRAGFRATAAGTVSNAGVIAGVSPSGFGVYLGSGGAVTNATGGTIASARAAVYARGGGYVTNASGGTINGLTEILDAAGTVINAGGINTNGSAFLGVYLNSGGTVANAAGGTIGQGVKVGAGGSGNRAGSVTNAGSITGSSYGIALGIGEVDNLATGQISVGGFAIAIGTGLFSPPAGESVSNAGTVTGGGGGVLLRGQGTVTNTGSIRSTGGVGVSLAGGGLVTNAAGRTIAGASAAINAAAAATVSNAGTLLGATEIFLGAGGSATNAAGGVLGATTGFGPSAYGVDARGTATVVNAGIIGAKYFGIALRQGGSATNSLGAVIYAHGTDILATTSASTAVNFGTLTAGNGGILLGAGGYALNAATGVIRTGGGYGMAIGTGGGTMVNAGRITQTTNGFAFSGGVGMSRPATLINQGGSIGGFAGVWVDFGGGVTNASNATIAGYNYGVFGHNNVVQPVTTGTTVDNSGSIGATFWGVRFNAGGTVTNRAGASITGPFKGIAVYNVGATIANYGTIRGGAGVIVNDQTATANNTVINAGTIIGTSGASPAAVSFGNGNDRLVVRPGAAFQGTVNGGGGTNTLEFGGTGPGTLAGLGSAITNFGSLVFDPGAAWTVAGNAAGINGATIAGFAAGDVIDLAGLSETITGFANGTLTLGGSQTLSLVFSGAVPASFQVASDNAGGTNLSLACFVEGTRIRAAKGEAAMGGMAVEDLAMGDRVSVAEGGHGRVVWIGRRTIDCARHPHPERVWPIRIAAGAFGPSCPARDLLLSPDHGVFAEGVLIPAGRLVNGTTVTREPRRRVRYLHIELERHDILYAEGLTVESYLDTGGRAAFEGGAAALDLHPDLGPAAREARGCAPLVVVGAAVDRVRAHLAGRQAALFPSSVGPSPSSIGPSPSSIGPSPSSRPPLRHPPA